jgi:type II restriction/modification system DNA methylase subunit YeeA
VTPSEFAAKWTGSTRTERAAAQEHFIDLCRMLGYATPNQADPTGEWYAFEKGAEKTEGGDGFADVWKRGHFGWEYKGKKKDLGAAYKQLLDYREALENPPLLVVCDLNRFEVHTNFTNSVKKVHVFDLADIAADPKEPLRVLRAVMGQPEGLRPSQTRDEITRKAARQYASVAISLRDRGHDPQQAAHFLNKLLFTMFAEDAGLLPSGLLRRLIEGAQNDPATFSSGLSELFGKMSEHGGLFGTDKIEWFNGGLFDGPQVIELTSDEIKTLLKVSKLDWSEVEPAIFGTLFERGLDPGKRSQLGAHYTDRAAIERLVEPVVITPIRRAFEAMKAKVMEIGPDRYTIATTPFEKHPRKQFEAFLDRLRGVTVLDPACGSGNFLYIALQALKDLEREAIIWGSTTLRTPMQFPRIGPEAVKGIELNLYAAEIARVVIWIGEIQWMLNNGFAYRRNPVLRPLENIECRDALLATDEHGNVIEADWPEATFIVGNPPFLGAKLLRRHLGNDYVGHLFRIFGDRLPGMSDFVAYWHEKARRMIELGQVQKVGLLATQGIRGGAGRRVLERIKDTGDIYMAWSDEPWILEGAAVHISFIAYDNGSETTRTLNGTPVAAINANLTSGPDLTTARRLSDSADIAFIGDQKSGPFDIDDATAMSLLAEPNPDGRSNASVVRRWANGIDLTQRGIRGWIIDFGVGMSKEQAALYEAPFSHVEAMVKPAREASGIGADLWWLHWRPRPEMRAALAGLSRFIATPRVSKHRIFTWVPADVLLDSAAVAIARDDDYTFGILHSRVHELWARGMGTQLREVESGFRYTPSTTFETFPFPDPSDEQKATIAEAASRLDELRRGWLNAPGLEPEQVEERTLTNLYNQRPAWLGNVHEELDGAVLAAYGWPSDLTDDDVLGSLLDLNLAQASS